MICIYQPVLQHRYTAITSGVTGWGREYETAPGNEGYPLGPYARVVFHREDYHAHRKYVNYVLQKEIA